MKIQSIVLLISISVVNLVFAQSTVRDALQEFVTDPAMKNASIGFEIVDLSDQATLAAHDPYRSLPSASTAKLFSTAAALEILGSDFRPVTRLYYDGTIDSNGVLNGNLWIRGGGDPSLGSRYFYDEDQADQFLKEWAQSMQKAGIKTINGAVIADASEFGYSGVPDGWNWVDMGNYYGAGPSGLSLYDNMARFYFQTPNSSGLPSTLHTISPTIPGLTVHNYVLSSTKKGDNAYIYGAPYSLDRFVSGTLPIGQQNFMVKGSIPDPERQFAFELVRVLSDANISVLNGSKSVRYDQIETDPKQYDQRTLLITTTGFSLQELIVQTNLKSINLYAEHMLSLIGYAQRKNGSIESGLSVMNQFWSNKINPLGLHLNDGSGLSRTNAISAHHFVEMLTYMHNRPSAENFRASLPVSGISGTLKSLCKNQAAHGLIQAKSGTMSRIKSYAGYITDKKGKTYAFALIVNNFNGSSNVLRQKMERLFNAIVQA